MLHMVAAFPEERGVAHYTSVPVCLTAFLTALHELTHSLAVRPFLVLFLFLLPHLCLSLSSVLVAPLLYSSLMPKPLPPQPMEVYVDDETKLTLHGLQQHYVKLQDREKNRKLFDLMDALEFNQVGRSYFTCTCNICTTAFLSVCVQVIIFVKSVQRCMALSQLLVEQNFPAICIHRGMPQEERLEWKWALIRKWCALIRIRPVYLPPRLAKYQAFKSFNKRIMVATDLFGRGMDIERVNIVINYDMPESSDTYLHRVSGQGGLAR